MSLIKEQYKKNIKEIIFHFVDNVINRRVVTEPYDPIVEAKRRPFHYALVPEEIWKGAKFERSFVTSLGMIGWEQIAKNIAEALGCHAENKKYISGPITLDQQRIIQTILNELEHTPRKPDWDNELKEIDDASKGEKTVPITVISDLYIKKNGGEELFIEIKSSLPNSDQTKVSKEKMLKLYAMNPQNRVYFALPDNPFGTKEEYNHPYPKRWFNMNEDSVVVIAEGFWDDILGKAGTFQELIKIFQEAGEITKKKIKEQYLGIK